MYRIIFEDEEIWNGGDIEQSNWNKMPNKPIKRIEYSLMNHTAMFEGYEEYNHLIEKVQGIYGFKGMRITKVILMAKKNNTVYAFNFDFTKNEIYPTSAEIGKEYYGKATSGWKKGLKNSDTKYNLITLK